MPNVSDEDWDWDWDRVHTPPAPATMSDTVDSFVAQWLQDHARGEIDGDAHRALVAGIGGLLADRERLLATVVRDLGGELLFDTDLETRPVLIEQRGDGWSVVLAPAPATAGGDGTEGER